MHDFEMLSYSNCFWF